MKRALVLVACISIVGCGSGDDSPSSSTGGGAGSSGASSGGSSSGGASSGGSSSGGASTGGTAGGAGSSGSGGSAGSGGSSGASSGGTSSGGTSSGGTSSGGASSGGSSSGGSSSGGSSSGGSSSGGSSGGNLNPDNVTPATNVMVTRDYETQNASEVLSDPNIATGQWSNSSGYGSGGWLFHPAPIAGTAENEDSAGWLMPWGAPTFPVDGYHLVTVSFMLKISAALLNEINIGGPFWAHVNKAFDFKYWDAAGTGEGGRNGIHFGESPPRFWFSSGGGGQFQAIGPDWRTLADQWVWVCFVVDMRAAQASQRTLAAYYKTTGGNVQLMGKVAENNPTLALQAYAGRGFLGFFSPLFGYWDDMHGGSTLSGNLSAMTIQLDRVRIANGWPTGANGPPN